MVIEVSAATDIDLGSEEGIDAGVENVMEGLGEDLTNGYKPDAEGAAAGDNGAEAPGATGDGSGDPTPPTVAAPAPSAEGPAAPETWATPEDQALWARLDPEAKNALTQREAQYQEALGQYRQASDIGVRLGKEVEAYLPLYQQSGTDVWTVMKDVLGAHAVMAYGRPEQKVEMFRALAGDIGIDIAALAQGGGAAAQTELAQLRQEITQLRQGMGQVTSTMQEARVKEQTDNILAFGDRPEHPYFWEPAVFEEVQRLMQTGGAKNLESAYEKAVWANPVTRQKEIDRISGEKAAAAATAAKAKAKTARTASSVNLNGARGGRPLAAKPGSVDDTLNEAFREIQSRT